MGKEVTKKGMTPKDYFSLAFGSMIGIGWAVSAPLWVSNAGSIGALIAIAVTVLIVLPVGFSYAELCSSVKVTGGEFAYTYKMLGRFPSFFCGWFLVFGYFAMLPWMAVAVSTLVSHLIPACQSIPLYEVLGYTIYLPELIINLIMVWGIVYINLKGAEASKVFQNAATIMLLAALAIFLVAGFVVGDTANMQPLFNPPENGGTVPGIILAVASILFFMTGFDTIPKTIDEADSGVNYKNLGRVIVFTIVFGGLVYSGIALASGMLMKPGDSVQLGSLPLVTAFSNATGSPLLTYIMAFGILMGVVTSFNGFLLAGSKLVAGFASAGFLSRSVGEVDPKTNMPKKMLIFMGIFSTFGCMVGKGLLTPVIIMEGIAFLIAWFFVTLSCTAGRSKMPNMVRPYKVPGGRATMIIGVILTAGLTVAMVIPGTAISLGKVENILLAIWVALGIAVYFLYKKQDIRIAEKDVPVKTAGKVDSAAG